MLRMLNGNFCSSHNKMKMGCKLRAFHEQGSSPWNESRARGKNSQSVLSRYATRTTCVSRELHTYKSRSALTYTNFLIKPCIKNDK
jgi:hypothetical protein